MNSNKPNAAAIVAQVAARRRRRWLGRGLLLLLAVGAVLALARYQSTKEREPAFSYVTKPTRAGDLRETVTATGTLKGLDSVDVGAQISGRVSKVFADFNQRVKTGDVLAEIAPEQLRSRVEQSGAQVRVADAAVNLAQATLAEAQSELARTQELQGKGLASARDLQSAEANAARAQASVASTRAQASLARAALKDQQTQLSYTTIRAPIDGIVLARLVEPGQTVAASLQSPVLFTLARDLSQLELQVDVDEADVGRVRAEQNANFTVDAWPGRKFDSRVVRVHNLPTAGQTVVTYRAVLSVNNQDLALRPGMTATATIVTADKQGVLLVPNAALRFTPPSDEPKKAARPSSNIPFMVAPPRMRGSVERSPKLGPGEPASAVWLLEGNTPRRVGVAVGGTDGEWTEVVDQSLTAGQAVIIDVEERSQRE